MRRENFRLHLRLLNARGTDDNERMVLPAIVFMSDQDAPFHAVMIAIGWWAWGIGLVLTWNTKPSPPPVDRPHRPRPTTQQ